MLRAHTATWSGRDDRPAPGAGLCDDYDASAEHAGLQREVIEMAGCTVGGVRDGQWGRARVASFCVVALVVAIAVAACGGGGPSGNGVASKSPAAILAAATSAFGSAKSLHISGFVDDNGTKVTLDLDLVGGRGGSGTMALGNLGFKIVEIGTTLYVNGDSAFWTHYGGATAAGLFAGKWLEIPSSNSAVAAFASLTNLADFRGLLSTALSSSAGGFTKGSTTTVDGQQVVSVSEKNSKAATLYVATTGRPYPVEIVQTGKGRLVFDHYGESVSLTKPAHVVAYP